MTFVSLLDNKFFFLQEQYLGTQRASVTSESLA